MPWGTRPIKGVSPRARFTPSHFMASRSFRSTSPEGIGARAAQGGTTAGAHGPATGDVDDDKGGRGGEQRLTDERRAETTTTTTATAGDRRRSITFTTTTTNPTTKTTLTTGTTDE